MTSRLPDRHQRLQQLWWSGQTPPWALRMLARAFGTLVFARRAAYAHGLLRAHRLGKPVIVVGNLTVGGSGKTPLVIWCCAQLRELGYRVGIVLRGYGGAAERGADPQRVSLDSDPDWVGDEALLLAVRTGCPVIVGRDRVRAARQLIAEGVDVVLCDDGLQHLRLARDLELVVVDAGRALGNGQLLPAGPLREPPERLASVDALVLNGEGELPLAASLLCERVPRYRMHLTGEELRPLKGEGAGLPLSQLAGQPVHALAGIGHPERFFALLRGAGLQVIAHAFPDHHDFQAGDLRFGDTLPLLMTEKDAVKCRRLRPDNAWFLPVTASFPVPQAAALRERLESAVRSHASPAGSLVPL